jgi:sec-independent protein translocase protein TatA
MGIENPVHLLFIAVIALLVLGPRRLPDLARAVGKGVREFRDAINSGSEPEQVHPPAEQALVPAAPVNGPAQPVSAPAQPVQAPAESVQVPAGQLKAPDGDSSADS